jgi:enamine deaminase RidA (YjgF/YER057c/UK114 family)
MGGADPAGPCPASDRGASRAGLGRHAGSVAGYGWALDRITINPDNIAAPAARYSHAVRIALGDGAVVFTSGVIAVDPTGAFVGAGDIRAQTERIFENLRVILDANGASFSDVIKITTYMTDLTELPAWSRCGAATHRGTAGQHDSRGEPSVSSRRVDRGRVGGNRTRFTRVTHGQLRVPAVGGARRDRLLDFAASRPR